MVLAATGHALAAPNPTHWCGTDEVGVDRLPDAVAAQQLHAVYAVPSDGTDEFAQDAVLIARDLASIDTWWRQQDLTRAPRWDLQSFPGCDTTFGDLDITSVRLPEPGPAYAQMNTTGYDAIVRDLSPALRNIWKKYVVFYDGPIAPDANVCGVSNLGPTTIGLSDAIVAVRAPRCGTLGSADYLAHVAAHEIVHNLGGVDVGAPHRCSGSHVCDSIRDLMSSSGSFYSLFDYVLDVGHDDYYGHTGDWWDVQDSAWLLRPTEPQYTLVVARAGKGTVESDYPGIICPPTCSIAWERGSTVLLFATERPATSD